MEKEITTNIGLRHFPFGLFYLDGNFQILDYSNPVVEILELDNDQIVGKNVKKYFSELPQKFKGVLSGNLILENTLDCTLLHITRKSHIKWLKLILYPLDESGTYYLRIEDVTKGKISLDLASRVEKAARIGSWEVDFINNELFWSDMTKEIHEVPLDFVPDLEKGIQFYKEGYHRERIVELVSNAIEEGSSFDEELVLVTAKGNELWVRAIGQAEFVNGKCSRLFGVFQDINKSMLEAEQLKTLSSRMSLAVESANIGIWDFNIVDNTLIWDENMYKLYGVDKTKFSGDYDAWERTLHPEDRERSEREVQDAIIGKKSFNTEFRIIRSDGTIRHITGMAKVFRDDEGNPLRMVGANTDVTALKNTHDRLRKLLKVTKRQNKSLLNFAHIVSHNLRTNSSNLLMLSEMLLTDQNSDNSTKLIEMVRTSSEHLDQTLKQLNEIIKIRNNENQNFEKLNIFKCIQSVTQSISALVDKSGAEIQINVPKSLTVMAIRPYFDSILLNLLTNSMKYKSNRRKLKILIAAEADSNSIRLRFSDNGRGIDLKLFGDKLFGLHGTFHGNSDANGFGLFIVKNQVESMNGTIAIESEVEVGTTFKLTFDN